MTVCICSENQSMQLIYLLFRYFCATKSYITKIVIVILFTNRVLMGLVAVNLALK